jgi:predicted nucleic acid-binding protein
MLVDTSIWVDHFRRGQPALTMLLEQGAVECHPFVIGELACGGMRRRSDVLALLEALPRVPTVDHDEALAFLDRHSLAGTGLGWVDVHLLASVQLAPTTLWTRDRRLRDAARRLGLSADVH